MKYIIKSEQRVKPFSRTRKGKIERVKGFTRQGIERTPFDEYGHPKSASGYPKATHEAAVHQLGKDYGISKKEARKILAGYKEFTGGREKEKFDPIKEHLHWEMVHSGKFGEPYSTGKTFNYDKMKRLIDSDEFLKRMFNNTPGKDEKIAEVMFNTYVVGDSVMEKEYNKKGKIGEPFKTTSGSQTRESLEDAGYELVSKKGGEEVILKDKETGKYELWRRKDDFAGYTVDIGGKGYEFIRGVDREVQSPFKRSPGSIPALKKKLGEPFVAGEKVKVWKGEHQGKEGEVVSTDGMDVKIKVGEETIEVPKHRVVGGLEKAVQVKGFTRTRKGRLERVKPFSREMQYVIKPKTGEPFKPSFIAGQKADAWERAKGNLITVLPMSRRSEGYKAGRADKLLGISLDVARTSHDTEYAEGYRRGQLETHSVAFKGEPFKTKEPHSPTSAPGKPLAEWSFEDIVGDKAYEDKFPIRPVWTEPDEDYRSGEDMDPDGTLAEIAGSIAQHYFPEDVKGNEQRIQDWSEKWWKNWRAGNSEEDFDKVDIGSFAEDLRDKFLKESSLEEPDFIGYMKKREGYSKETNQAVLDITDRSMEQLGIKKLGEPLSTEGLASAEEEDEDETVSEQAINPEGGTTETKRKSRVEILELDEAKTSINKLVDMSNTIIDDNAVKQMKDALSKLEINNDWEFKDYKDLVEFSEGELKDAKANGYNSVNEYWQSEMPESVTATTSRKVRKSMKLQTIDEVLNLKKGKYDFGEEVPILSRPATELEKSKGPWKRGRYLSWKRNQSEKAKEELSKKPLFTTTHDRRDFEEEYGKQPRDRFEKATQQVKGFTRTRKGKRELVKPFSRTGKEKAIVAHAPSTYSAYESAVNYAKNIKGLSQEDSVKWARMANEFERSIRSEKDTARKAEKIYGKQDAKEMREMHLGDAKDLQRVYDLWKREDYEEAYNKAMDMDTAARDGIPNSVWEDIDKYRQQNLGEPFSFKGEQKKVSDKWEGDLAEKLGIIKDKMQNKQPVSKQELDEVIKEAENWRSFKGQPFKTLENTSHEERMQVASTILFQMGGGAGRIKAMTGAKNFIALPSGVSFEFPARKGPNYCKVTLEPDDTYTVEFGRKMGMQKLMSGNWNVDDIYKKGNEYKDVYAEDLKEMFERETGLYLSFTKSVTGGDRFVISLEKGRGPDRQPRKRRLGDGKFSSPGYGEYKPRDKKEAESLHWEEKRHREYEQSKANLKERIKLLEEKNRAKRLEKSQPQLPIRKVNDLPIFKRTEEEQEEQLEEKPEMEKSKGPWKKGKKVNASAYEMKQLHFQHNKGLDPQLAHRAAKKWFMDRGYDYPPHWDKEFGGKKFPLNSKTYNEFTEKIGKHAEKNALALLALKKSKGGFRMAHGEKGESEKIEEKKEQKESGEEPSQKQQRMSNLAKRRKEEQGLGKDEGDGGDAGLSSQERGDVMTSEGGPEQE